MKKILIFTTLILIFLFGIFKPLQVNAYYDDSIDVDYYMSAQQFHNEIYTPMVENSDFYYSFDYLENYYGSTAEDLIPVMVDLINQYYARNEYLKGYNDGENYVWDLVENDQVYNAKDVILGIFDAPLRILEKAFTFEVFGIEVYNIILFVLTMGVVYFVWKRVKK